MEALLAIIPSWIVIILIVAIVATIIFVVVRGIQLKFRGITVDTANQLSPYKSVNLAHIVQFRRLKTTIESDIQDTRNEYQHLFVNLFITMLTEQNLGYETAANHNETLSYENIVKFVLNAGYVPTITKTIFGNHFPERGNKRGKLTNELDRDFQKRFLDEYSKPTVISILTDVGYTVDRMWESSLIERPLFQQRMKSEAFLKDVFAVMHTLLMNSMGKRNYAFEQISRQDGTSIDELKHEWEQIYG